MMSIMPKEDWDAIPTIVKFRKTRPLFLHRMIVCGSAFCLSCGYIIRSNYIIEGVQEPLYEGYGCPECKSPFVVCIGEIEQ